MGRTKISSLILGVALLLILGALMLTLGTQNDLIGLAAEATATALPSPAHTPALTWENASLDQIHFGEPKVVLTDTMGLRIVEWISNDEILILRDTSPIGKRVAIEVFNVESRSGRRVAEGNIWGKPVWSLQKRAVTYLLYDESRKTISLVWHPLDGQPVRIFDNAVQPIVLSPAGEGAMACSRTTGNLRGKVYAPPEREIRIGFARFAPPARTLGCGWKYDTAVSPDGKWQVVYNCEHFLLVNSEAGVIKELDLGTEVIEGRAFPRWALDAQWSPNGQMLAVVATMDRLPNQIRFLLLLDPWKNGLRAVSLPYGFPTELSWAPNSQFLLVHGEVGTIPPGFGLPRALLVNVRSSEYREVKLYPQGMLAGNIAWSPDGSLLAFLCRHVEEGHLGKDIAICLSSVEVGK